MSIPISTVAFGPDEEQLVLEVLRSGHIAQGPMVQRLEEAFQPLSGCEHVVAVSNGTVALVAALEALGVGPGDEVITSAFTFAATLNAILEVGATARFADIGADFLVDVDAVKALVNERTAALLPVHLYGQMADMPGIEQLARETGAPVVEDAAQAHGARLGDRAAGSFGVGCFSLYATKNVTTGEGGLVTTNDAAVADRLRVLRNQGMRRRYEYEMAGHNYRMTDLQAALGIPQLAALPERNEVRRSNAARLTAGLADVAGLAVPEEAPGRHHVWHQYTVRVLPDAPLTRDELVERLTARGIGCGVYYPRLVFDYDCYRDDPRVITDDVPTARRMAEQVVSLPVHPQLSDADLDTIIAGVRAVFDA